MTTNADVWVQVAQNEADVRCVYDVEQQEYGADSILSLEVVLGWWRQYRHGIYCLRSGSKIIGGMGLWPLSDSAFSALMVGSLDETEMRPDHIVAEATTEPLIHWYVADIILQPEYRRTRDRWAGVLLEGTIRAWVGETRPPPLVTFCALVYSRQGRALAEKLGFRYQVTSPDGYGVYALEAAPQKLYDTVTRRMLSRRRQQQP